MTPADTRPSERLGRTSERMPSEPAGGNPGEPEGEGEDEEEAEPEERQRDAGVGEDAAESVDPGALPERGEDAGGDADEDGEENAAKAEG